MKPHNSLSKRYPIGGFGSLPTVFHDLVNDRLEAQLDKLLGKIENDVKFISKHRVITGDHFRLIAPSLVSSPKKEATQPYAFLKDISFPSFDSWLLDSPPHFRYNLLAYCNSDVNPSLDPNDFQRELHPNSTTGFFITEPKTERLLSLDNTLHPPSFSLRQDVLAQKIETFNQVLRIHEERLVAEKLKILRETRKSLRGIKNEINALISKITHFTHTGLYQLEPMVRSTFHYLANTCTIEKLVQLLGFTTSFNSLTNLKWHTHPSLKLSPISRQSANKLKPLT
ncbi:MAG: hypothetical protein ACKVT2_00465 [Saprospiraceae bacterium]